MKNYELLYIISNQYTEDEAQKIKEKIKGVLKNFEAILGYEEDLGKKKLAYPIKQLIHGYYFLAEFELEDGRKIKEINNWLRLDKEILRAQIITKKKLTSQEKEEIKRRESARPKTEKSETKTLKPENDKKIDIKNLDEKLEEILKSDDLV